MRFSFFALLVLALGAVNPTNAQSELEVFSEMGDAFTLYLNQMKMNEEPAPRVLVEVNAGFYQVRIDFEESGRADLFKNNFGTEAGMRTTGKITMNRKGEFVLRPFGHVPMSQAPAAPAPIEAPFIRRHPNHNDPDPRCDLTRWPGWLDHRPSEHECQHRKLGLAWRHQHERPNVRHRVLVHDRKHNHDFLLGRNHQHLDRVSARRDG